jgi:hypothetical protein
MRRFGQELVTVFARFFTFGDFRQPWHVLDDVIRGPCRRMFRVLPQKIADRTIRQVPAGQSHAGGRANNKNRYK